MSIHNENQSDGDLRKKYTKDSIQAELFKYAMIFILIPLAFLIKHFVNDLSATIVLILGTLYISGKCSIRCPKCGFYLRNLGGISFWRQRCIRCGFELEPHAKISKKKNDSNEG